MHVMILLWRIIWIVPYALSWGITYVLARVMYGVHHEVRDRHIIDGTIDGTVYEGDCACLIGTLAKSRHCLYNQIHGLVPNKDRPAERFFLGIRPGDTPENSQLSALVMAWIDQFLEKKIA